jgi:hypothetical protein
VPSRLSVDTGQKNEVRDHIVYQFDDMGTSKPLRMEMFGLARPVVEYLVQEAGAQVCHVQPDQWAGPNWESFFYVVTK